MSEAQNNDAPQYHVLTEEEEAEAQRNFLHEQEKAVWMQYSMIAMQAIKLQGGEFKDNRDIARKAASLADSMVAEYKDRFYKETEAPHADQ